MVFSDFEALFAVRFLAGLGFGAALPNMMAIATELSSAGRRASTAALMFCGFPLGGGTVALLTQVLPPVSDWRVLFIMGGVLPALLVPALYWLSARDVDRRQRAAPKDRAPVFKALFGDGRAAPTLLLWLAFLPTLLILYLILNWLPTLVVAKGLDAPSRRRRRWRSTSASIAGALMFGRLVDRFGPALAADACVRRAHRVVHGARCRDRAAHDHRPERSRGLLPVRRQLRAVRRGAGLLPDGHARHRSGRERRRRPRGLDPGSGGGGCLLAGGTTATDVVQYLAPVAAVAGIAVFSLSFFRREH